MKDGSLSASLAIGQVTILLFNWNRPVLLAISVLLAESIRRSRSYGFSPIATSNLVYYFPNFKLQGFYLESYAFCLEGEIDIRSTNL